MRSFLISMLRSKPSVAAATEERIETQGAWIVQYDTQGVTIDGLFFFLHSAITSRTVSL